LHCRRFGAANQDIPEVPIEDPILGCALNGYEAHPDILVMTRLCREPRLSVKREG
jgi:hypothetical protein